MEWGSILIYVIGCVNFDGELSLDIDGYYIKKGVDYVAGYYNLIDYVACNDYVAYIDKSI